MTYKRKTISPEKEKEVKEKWQVGMDVFRVSDLTVAQIGRKEINLNRNGVELRYAIGDKLANGMKKGSELEEWILVPHISEIVDPLLLSRVNAMAISQLFANMNDLNFRFNNMRIQS